MLRRWLPSAVRPPGHGWTHECPVPASGHGRGGTPGPIPNPEVKPPSADGTAERVRGRAGRRWPAEGIRAREGGERIRAPLPLHIYAYAQPGRRAPASCGGPSCICRHSCRICLFHVEALLRARPPSLCSRPCAPCMRGLHPPGPAEAPSLRSSAIYAGQPLLPAHMPSRASPAGHLRACELCRNCAEAGMCWRRAEEERIVIPRAQAHPEIRDAGSAANLENRILRSKRSEDRRERCYRQDSIRRFNSLRDMNPDRRELERRDGGSIDSMGHASGHGHI